MSSVCQDSPQKYLQVFTRAIFPQSCCAVVFCSLQCRAAAVATYHRYECDMRLYELIPAEGKVARKNIYIKKYLVIEQEL